MNKHLLPLAPTAPTFILLCSHYLPDSWGKRILTTATFSSSLTVQGWTSFCLFTEKVYFLSVTLFTFFLSIYLLDCLSFHIDCESALSINNIDLLLVKCFAQHFPQYVIYLVVVFRVILPSSFRCLLNQTYQITVCFFILTKPCTMSRAWTRQAHLGSLSTRLSTPSCQPGVRVTR